MPRRTGKASRHEWVERGEEMGGRARYRIDTERVLIH